ncbi:serine hydrolase domain-containing protein [Allostreptomyces psammosilenae]|uniref:CubicO group peptidase (Beta-lactamase class C family) n=1 Tax=Allostreptomyces psammosilenae TaxID=1892865 RepID=A0A853A2W2_9ACTN|nr:serine hydrolase domain-containing protein [Allostreptomyces psammosilenae]NYI04808.1 CubicO group peptidase (beta-lactamase class C family) [Allostreptomyces psammosilenae]
MTVTAPGAEHTGPAAPPPGPRPAAAPSEPLTGLVTEYLDRAARALPPAPAAVWGALRDGERALVCRAGEGPYAAAPPDEHTVFELGSLTKTFTALLLAEMAARGEVRYRDPVDAYLPAGARPRRRRRDEHHPLTLRHLATHTGGLPRLPANLLPYALRDLRAGSPYGGYQLAHLYAATARLGRGPRPGSLVRYSNYGVGLLGQALANAVDSDYGTLVAERICGPLGLADTVTTGRWEASAGWGAPPAGPRLHRIAGHRGTRPVPPWRMAALAGAGALLSSGHDLLRYLDALLGRPGGAPAATRSALPPSLAAALEDVRRPRLRMRDGDEFALVWFSRTVDGRQVLFHSGGTLGCTTFLAYCPDARAAVVALSAAGCRRREPLLTEGYDLLRRLMGAG